MNSLQTWVNLAYSPPPWVSYRINGVNGENEWLSHRVLEAKPIPRFYGSRLQASAEKQPPDYKWWAALSKPASAKLAKQEGMPIYGQLYCLQGTVPLAGVSMTTG